MLADEASRLADEFLHVCIRAIDYCPPMDVRFGEYLRAIITADRMLNHDDRFGIRDALIKEFRRRSIDLGRVRDLSDYSLEWNFPSRKEGLYIRGLAWSQLRFRNDGVTPLGVAEIERQDKALGDFLLHEIGKDELAEFGLQPPGLAFGPVTVESLRCVTRRSRDGRVTHGMVAEVSQQCATSHGATIGGSTIILEEDGRVQFAIKKRVGNRAREHSRADYLKRTGRSELISFKALHSSSL